MEHRDTSRPNRLSAEQSSLPVPPIFIVWERFCFTSLLGGLPSWARMSLLLFIRLLRLQRRVCVHSPRRWIATLETIVARCLESDPNARYQSAAALADDLEHWLRHEPIRARRTGVFTRGRKWVRRNPTSAALLTSLVALGVAVGVMFWERQSSRPPLPLPGGIAVLPFENLSADPENAFFTDGVQDEILNVWPKSRT